MDKKNFIHACELRTKLTQEEQLVWERVRDRRLGGLAIRRHAVVHTYIVDFLCCEARAVLEIDDGRTWLDEERYSATMQRDDDLRSHGYVVLRMPNHLVTDDVDSVLHAFEYLCRSQIGFLREFPWEDFDDDVWEDCQDMEED